MRKQKFIILSFSLILIFNLMFGSIVPAIAAENTVKSIDKKLVFENPGSAVSDGKYIYYAYQGDGKRMGITKLDLTNFKQKVIAKPIGNSYTNLSLKGDYIYTVLDKAVGYGVGNEETYIYRISKDGKKQEKLAVGKEPVIVGTKIYYFSGKIVKLNDEERGIENLNNFEGDGYISSMDLNGKNKKKVAKVNAKSEAWYRLFKSGNKVYYENENNKISDLEGNIVEDKKIISTGELRFWGFGAKYSYDVRTKLQYHKVDKYGEDKLQVGTYKGGKWNYKTIAKFNMTEQASVFDEYIITKVFEQQKSEELLCKVYLLDKKGKVLKELDSFVPAE